MATGLDHRHRDENGEISHKHGNTLVGTLRKIYGPGFAPSFQPDQELSEVLDAMDEPSLSKLLQDHRDNKLHGKILFADTI